MCLCAADCISQERTISFPTGWKHASIAIYDGPILSDQIPGFLEFQSSGKAIGVAEGTITVPEDSFVGVEINGVEGHQEFLSHLPSHGIQRIDLLNVELSNAMFEHIERVSSLRQVTMVNCVASNVDESLLVGLPRMQFLLCRQRNQSPETHKIIAAWAAKSPNLQFYYDGANLSLKEIRRFAGHQAPLFITIAFESDAVAVIDALAAIPNLVGLNVRVTDDAPAGYHRFLARLKHLKIANWGGGNMDGNFLRSIANVQNLSIFRVQGNARVSDAFIENLPQLKSIEAISFNFPLSNHQRQVLSDVLLGMENISELPELTDLSTDQLAMLCERVDIKSLRISGLKEDASSKQLAKVVGRNNRLSRLTLRDVQLTPEIAKAICGSERLQHLELDVQDFDGRLFPDVNRLRELKSITLNVRGRALDLSVLGKFPNLATIKISLNTYDTSDWSFIADASSLRSLEVFSGHCDDAIVKWIIQNDSLRSFSTHQCGILTDAGVTELSQCNQLESLAIEGFITESVFQGLKKLPKLRRLSVSTDMLTEPAIQRIKGEFAKLEYFSLREFNPATGKIVAGADRIYRQMPDVGRDDLDALEGTSLEAMLGDYLTDELRQRLDGKVVLVEFWGTWCGPCLNFIPELERLQEKYGKRGFEVLAIHSEMGSEKVAAYLEINPKPWPNLIDKSSKLQESFAVPSYPSTYIFGTNGEMRVALPYRQSLGHALDLLLNGSD